MADDINDLKPQSKPTLRDIINEIGGNRKELDRIVGGGKYYPGRMSQTQLEAIRLLQAANQTQDPNRWLETLQPYDKANIEFNLNNSTEAGYVDKDAPNRAVIQNMRDVANTVPHELTHTLQLKSGEAMPDIIDRARSLPPETRSSIFPSKNKFDNPLEVWANINARAHNVAAEGGDFINSPEGKALFPDQAAQREYFTKAMPSVNSWTPDTGTFVPNNESLLAKAKRVTGFADGGLIDPYSTPMDAIKDRVMSPNANEMLNLDLAKLSMMNQPRRMAGGGLARKAAKAAEKAIEAAPTSRIDMNFKDVTKRTPELQEAAQRIASGEMSAAEYDALVNQVKPVTPYDFVPAPATREEAMGALTSNKQPKWGAADQWEAGTPVGLRLDIPAYSNHGVWVNSIHGPDSTAYGNVSSVRDATFGKFEDKALRVAQGDAKSPFAKIEGKWNPVSEADAIERANEYLKHPEWRQVGMDPERHGYFYDRETMQPVLSSEEVLQIGPLVLAKKPVYGNKEDFKFAGGGMVHMAVGGFAKKGAKFVDKVMAPVFEVKDLGGLAPVNPISLETRIGDVINTNPWDVMSRNQQIVSVSDKIVPDEIITHGGQPYPRDLKHIKEGIGGASNEGIAKRVQERFDIASEEGKQQGGTGGVIATPFTMGDSSVNFALPTSNLYRSFFNKNATPADFQLLSDKIRETKVKGKMPFADAPNLDDPAVDQWFRDYPEFRKKFLEKMQTTKKWSEIAGIKTSDALAAMRDPNLVGVPPQYAGHTLIETFPGAKIRPSSNETYSHDTGGLYLGAIDPTPVPILLNEPFTAAARDVRAASLKPTWKAGEPTIAEIAAMATNALGTRKAGVSEMVTDKMLRRIEDYHKGLAKGEFEKGDIESALRYLNLPKFADGGSIHMDEGGEASQAELDRMKYELSRNEYPDSPVIEATPQSFTQKAIGTVGGYMDRAGNFVKETMAPIAESHPIRNFLVDTLLADPLKSAGSALQDYTKTSREITEDQPYRGDVFKGKGQTLSIDPRVLDIAQFAQPAASLATKAVSAGAKAVTPFAKNAAEMANELYMAGKMPGMVAPASYMTEPVRATERVLAPANEMGFYSPVEAAALNLQRKSGNGQAFLNDIMKGENVRPDEISTMGLDTFLSGKKSVTADEVKDYIAQNKIQLGESRYGELTQDDRYAEWERLAQRDYGKTYDDLVGADQGRVQQKARAEEKTPQYEEYSTPGGSNYREVVLTLQQSPEHTEFAKLSKKMDDDGLLSDDMNRWNELGEKLGADGRKDALRGASYTSSHWEDTNPIAHLRMQDFTDVEGKKTLLVDEVQSDWHQAGREKGYKTNSTPAQTAYRDYVDDVKNRFADSVREEYAPTIGHPDTLNKQVKKIVEDTNPRDMAKQLGETDKFVDLFKNYHIEVGQNRNGVPNAPFKDDWYQLALKRAVKEAVDNGYDRVALPTGQKVAERFDLSKQLDKIVVKKRDDEWIIEGYKGRTESLNHIAKDDSELASTIGKDLAKKVINDNGGTYAGLDLQVGGEGMKKYYDEVYPNYLKKFGKRYGAKVGQTEVTTPHKYTNEELSELFDSEGRIGESYTDFVYRVRDQGKPETIHYMDITPAMRDAFKTGIHMAEGGIVNGNNGLNYVDDGNVSMEAGGYVPLKRGGKVEFTTDLQKMRRELNKGRK